MLYIFKKVPIIKTMTAYTVVGTVADVNEQFFIAKRPSKDYDVLKTARIATVGMLVLGPLIYTWIKFIDKRLPAKNLVTIVKKVVYEQLFFAPIGISSFYVATNILERKTDLLEEWKMKFFTTWKTGWMYWPVVQAINFRFVPPAFKTSVYMPCASLLWITYLCYMKDKNMKKGNAELESSTGALEGR